jgi:hypothetical protein
MTTELVVIFFDFNFKSNKDQQKKGDQTLRPIATCTLHCQGANTQGQLPILYK